jgi:hypothetical protein
MAFSRIRLRWYLFRAWWLVREVKNDHVYDRAAWNDLRDDMIDWGKGELEEVWEELIQVELYNKRGLDPGDVPALILATLDRYKAHWENRITWAFNQAKDSATKGIRSMASRAGEEIGLDPEEPKKVLGYSRTTRNRQARWSMELIPYLKMLFRTIPKNLHRDLMIAVVKLDARLRRQQRELYYIKGGVRDNSAQTCRYANEKVFTRAALDFIKNSRRLKDHLFHPNCKHYIADLDEDYDGEVYTLRDVQRDARSHNLLR